MQRACILLQHRSRMSTAGKRTRRVTGVEFQRFRIRLMAQLTDLRDRLDRAVAEARRMRALIGEATDEETDEPRRKLRSQTSGGRHRPGFSHP